jgi:hypothetical protein
MAGQSRSAKLLRIAIIQDNKIVQERLIKAGEPVSVGESPRNTFVFPKTGLPKAEFVLFDWNGNNYVLRFTKAMKGRINTGSGVVALSQVRRDPSVDRKGSVWSLQLGDWERGKVKLDTITVLFQFVAPPPVQAVKPLEEMDFRPRLIDEDDPVFLGFLAVWSALGLLFAIWVYNTDLPPTPSLEELPDRFTSLVMQPDETEAPEVETTDLEDPDGLKTKAAEPEPEPTVAEVEPVADPAEAAEPPSQEEIARQKEELRQEVLKDSSLLKIIGIGTTGDNFRGTIDALSDPDGDYGDIEKRLSEVGTGEAQWAAADEGLRDGGSSAGGTADRDVAAVGTSGGGNTQVEADVPEVKVTPQVDFGNIETDSGDQGEVKKVIRKYQGQVKYCYEAQLKSNPVLEGRVVIDWTIEGGRVTFISVASNTTGNDALAQCIVGKIKRWQFSGIEDDEITFPFLLRPSE